MLKAGPLARASTQKEETCPAALPVRRGFVCVLRLATWRGALT